VKLNVLTLFVQRQEDESGLRRLENAMNFIVDPATEIWSKDGLFLYCEIKSTSLMAWTSAIGN
jgi:hypothetical protein